MNKQIMFSLMMLSCALPLQPLVTFCNNTGIPCSIAYVEEGEDIAEECWPGDQVEVALANLEDGFSFGYGNWRADVPVGFVQEDEMVFVVGITADMQQLVLTRPGVDVAGHYIDIYEVEQGDNDEASEENGDGSGSDSPEEEVIDSDE
ncbi:hypothetical protein K2X40_01375 [Candidatus Babeliales bacterium]|nr:hypothetical protein [Candidatus Babeliales bacterium]